MSFGARALIRLGALEHNLDVLRSAVPGARIMAVIKANAYGHGLVPVARHLEAADSLAVARLPEALLLRESGIDKPIVLLAGVSTADELRVAFAQGFASSLAWAIGLILGAVFLGGGLFVVGAILALIGALKR